MTPTSTSHTPPEFHTLPERVILAVDGEGAPEGDVFQSAVAVLDDHLGEDAPIQGTYWSGDDRLTFILDEPDGWRWTLAISEPPDLSPESSDLRDGVRRRTLPAQRVVRVIHHGPYVEEGPSLEALYSFIAEHGLEPTGAHTEVYLTDPREVGPDELRTELQVPVG